jgi:formate dehydrogenase major subunit
MSGQQGGSPQAAAEIRFLLDGRELVARTGETILQAAARHGIAIPHLCYTEEMGIDGNCRACVVEIAGERVLAPACAREPAPGMEVSVAGERARASQRLVLELLLADMPAEPYTDGSELHHWARRLQVAAPRFAPRPQPAPDLSHPAIAVRLDACIQCTRCVRACRDVQGNDVIGFAGRGAGVKVVFDLDDPMGASTCVACGECVQACPTGALLERSQLPGAASVTGRGAGLLEPGAGAGAGAGPGPGAGAGVVDTVCPYCGVGCQLTYHVAANRIVRATGRDGPSNRGGRLCVKGRFGFDYIHDPLRLTQPLIRRDDAPKQPDGLVEPARWAEVFREATWDEALDRAAAGLRQIRDDSGPGALAGFGCAKGSNEEAYLFQKLVRTGFGTNNVDHCTRLCHASSVAALLEMVGSGAVSNPVADVAYADVIMLVGTNTTVNHPVAATYMKNAAERGARIIVLDPRRTEIARYATQFLQFRPGTDVAVLNALMHVIVAEELVDEAFVAARTEGFDALQASLAAYSPEAMEPVCGIPAATLREVARLYATAPASMIFWGMGVSQHVHGTDNARALISLALMTGQIGRRGTGLHPLRGQNNVQGASDMGLIPMMYPDYRRVDDPAARAAFEALWGRPLDPRPGLTVVEILNAAKAGEIRGMYIMGENPAMSDPDVAHARAALAALDCLVVQDLFLTETACFADVILPASAAPEKTGTFTNTDRRVQLGRQALALPGDARQDLWILQELARRLGLDWRYDGPADVFAEIRAATPSYAGIGWERLEREDAVTYPCPEEGHAGQEVIFTETFPRPGGRARFTPVEVRPGDEPPDADYPFVLITGRLLEHWHTGAMTRRAEVLDALEPVPTAALHGEELERLGVRPGETVTLQTRRGRIVLQARRDDGTPRGAVYVPFAYVEAAANLLTNPALDPYGKIPEFKYCAVRVLAGGEEPEPAAFAAAARVAAKEG